MSTSVESLSAATIERLITRRVVEAMTSYEANQNNRNEDGNPNVNVGGVVPIARECTYQDFVKCQPLNFKGTEGVVGMTRCALTWWNSHKRTIGTDVAYAMTWKELMELMTERQNVARAYTVGNNKNKCYAGILPLYDKCKLHHHGPCPVRYGNCKKVDHQTRDCWASTTMTCYGYGGKVHTKRYYPKLGNQNGDREARQNLDIVM
nr:hypothetical protein [Tanacetum cinerariifolium]